MAHARGSTFTVVNGVIQGSKSKERWFPGDPLPWTTGVYQGIPLFKRMYDGCMTLDGFQTRADDVFVVTYPKSGTTWMLQTIKCLKTKGHPETLEKIHSELYPWIETDGREVCESLPSPRVMKSHGYEHLIVKGQTPDIKCKYIHVMRNPKDTCVSMYHHMKSFKQFQYEGEFPEFFDMFVAGKVECGSWLDFERGWLECKDETVLHVQFEDMKRHPADVIQRVADFMGLECNEEIIKLTIEKCSFSKMKEDKFSNMSWSNPGRREGAPSFMRKGEIGDWKNYFTEEQSERFDKWLAENPLPGVEFYYGA